MAFDRSKYQATSVATLKEETAAAEAVVKGGFEKTEYHKHEEGLNIYRLYPAHPDALTQAFAFVRVTHFIECEVPTLDKKGTELKKKHIFNARTHGGYPKDIIEEYIYLVKQALGAAKLTAAALKTRLSPIDDYKAGIKPQAKWMMYADKMVPGKPVAGKVPYTPVFGILELSQAQKDKLNLISQNESANEVIASDPFTDPDTGRALMLRKTTKDDKGREVLAKDMYTLQLDTEYDKESMKIRLFPLSDPQLEAFSAKEMLEKRFTNCYKRADFERAVAALEAFDMKHEYGVTGTETWNNLINEFDAMIPEDGEEDGGEGEDGDAPRGDKFARMNRDELKTFIRTEKLSIVPSQSMSDDTLRDLIRGKMNAGAPAPTNGTFPDEEDLGDDTSDGGQNLAQLQDAQESEQGAGKPVSARMAALKEKTGGK
jgi:hypothetical protein